MDLRFSPPIALRAVCKRVRASGSWANPRPPDTMSRNTTTRMHSLLLILSSFLDQQLEIVLKVLCEYERVRTQCREFFVMRGHKERPHQELYLRPFFVPSVSLCFLPYVTIAYMLKKTPSAHSLSPWLSRLFVSRKPTTCALSGRAQAAE